jgi:superfamily II DNA/RNA helicase
VDDVTHVINHTIPDDEKTYLHRVGRTGRAGKTGVAVTFVDWEDLHKWALINRALEFGQPEPVETYSSSPHLYSDLDIPAGARGRLKPTPAVKTAEGEAPRSAPHSESDSARSGGNRRRRTRSGRPADGAPAPAPSHADGSPAATGTHDGGGAQHRDGNSAPRRRRRSRGGSPATPAS